MKFFATSLFALAACSGGVTTHVPQDATIALDRTPVDVAAYLGTTTPVSLQILNQGRGLLTITSIKLAAADGGVLPGLDAGGVFEQPLVAVDAGTTSDPLPVALGGLQTGFIQFTYQPQKAGRTEALLVIESDDPARPTLTAEIDACATTPDGGDCE